ncbi:MAG: prepilin peptidase, partial [bacterium]|nr:prepilin peptidase [bacterium]
MMLILGLCVGSFLNVLIWRLNDEKAPKFWQGRSLCPKCKHQLSWKDNIPLLSFILLNGRCRYC